MDTSGFARKLTSRIRGAWRHCAGEAGDGWLLVAMVAGLVAGIAGSAIRPGAWW